MADSPLITYLRLQRALDRDVLAMLRVTYASVNSELRRLQSRSGIGARVREDQLRMTIVAINRDLSDYWAAVGDVVQARQYAAAAAAAQSMWDNSSLRLVLPGEDVDYLLRSAGESAKQSLRVAMERVSGSSYVPLAESVYNNQALASGKVDEIVNAAIGRGASAAELARDVRAYVNPNVRGGIKYASMRLGRTELNNAFHAGQVRSAQECPWTTGVLWNLSGSHPKPDECNTYADEVHFEGGDPGVFPPNEVPEKPHPNCLCFCTAETVSRKQFIAQFNSGAYDSVIDQMIREGGMTIR